jgi:hypothetical protein
VPVSLASTPTRTTTPTPTPQPQKLPYENLTQLKRSIAITVLQAPSSGIMGATHRAHDQDEDEMEIDPRLRDTPAATYTPQTHPPRASLQTPIAPQQSRSPVAPQQYQPVQEGSPQNYYLPQTPQSGGNEDNDAGNGTQDGGPNDPKRPRACEACKFQLLGVLVLRSNVQQLLGQSTRNVQQQLANSTPEKA